MTEFVTVCFPSIGKRKEYTVKTEVRSPLRSILTEIRVLYPNIRIAAKRDVWWSYIIHAVVCLLTLFRNRKYLSDYTSTFKNTILLSDKLDDYLRSKRYNHHISAYFVLKHEAVHLKQFQKLGTIGVFSRYVWPPFIKTRRASDIELPAYSESLISRIKYLGKAPSSIYREWWISNFTGPSYGWMYTNRKTVEMWYEVSLRAGLEMIEEDK